MPDTIDLLERLGQEARWRRATDDELRTALANAGIAPAAQEAIVTGDDRALTACLAARAQVCCYVWAPAKEEERPQKPPPQDEAPKSQQRQLP